MPFSPADDPFADEFVQRTHAFRATSLLVIIKLAGCILNDKNVAYDSLAFQSIWSHSVGGTVLPEFKIYISETKRFSQKSIYSLLNFHRMWGTPKLNNGKNMRGTIS